jgi:hypothetical protein
MADEENLRESLQTFFSSRGNRLVPLKGIPIEGNKPGLAFTDGANTTYLRILEKPNLQNRNGLLEAALDSVSYTSVANKVYLALPKVYATVVDAAILRDKGLGLVVYDARAVEEVLPAQFFDHKQAEVKTDADIEQLRKRISALERTVDMLNNELSRIKSIRPLQPGSNSIQPGNLPSIESPNPDGLPSFFRDNPWVDILTKRGKEFEQVAS